MEEISPISMAASGLSSVGNMLASDLAYKRQKQLNRQKYEDMISYGRKLGATPTSLIHGITGSAGGAMPSTSFGNNPISDLGESYSSGVQADAAKKQAVAAQDQAQAALTNAETERQLGLMKLKFEPKKYFADIQKSLAEAFENTKHAFLHGSMKQYYDELSEDIRQVRPWKIAGLRQSLLNDIATFEKIVQETKTSKAQEGYFKAGSHELYTRSDLNVSESYYYWNLSHNEALKGFRLQWEQDLLSYGIDPNSSFWQSSARLMVTNPKLFTDRMNMFVTALNGIDNRLQDNLGEHYKRTAILGYGLYKLNQIHQKNANSRSYRFNNGVSAISKLIPFLDVEAVPPPSTGGGVDWWLKD